MVKPIQLMTVLCLLCSSMTMAGTIIEIQNKGELTTIYTDGKHARMNMSGEEFVVADYENRQVRMVNPQKNEITLLDARQMPALSNSPIVRTEVRQRGVSNNIAGYTTHQYEYFANGKFCGFIYGSKTAYQVEGVKELFSAVKVLMDRQQEILGGLAGMLDVCTLADMKLSDHVATIGVPMRSERNGSVETEIKSIKVGVEIPGYIFEIPVSYGIVTMPGQTKEVAAEMPKVRQKTQQYQPQMQNERWQMRQSEQVPPHAVQQMYRTQEIMRQYPR